MILTIETCLPHKQFFPEQLFPETSHSHATTCMTSHHLGTNGAYLSHRQRCGGHLQQRHCCMTQEARQRAERCVRAHSGPRRCWLLQHCQWRCRCFRRRCCQARCDWHAAAVPAVLPAVPAAVPAAAAAGLGVRSRCGETCAQVRVDVLLYLDDGM